MRVHVTATVASLAPAGRRIAAAPGLMPVASHGTLSSATRSGSPGGPNSEPATDQRQSHRLVAAIASLGPATSEPTSGSRGSPNSGPAIGNRRISIDGRASSDPGSRSHGAAKGNPGSPIPGPAV